MMKNIIERGWNISRNTWKIFLYFYNKLDFWFTLKYVLFILFISYLNVIFDLYGLFFGVKKVNLMPPRPIEGLLKHSFSGISVYFYGSLSNEQAFEIIQKFKIMEINRACFQLVDYDIVNLQLKKIVAADHYSPLRHPNFNLLSLYKDYMVNVYGTSGKLQNFSLLKNSNNIINSGKSQYISNNLYVYSCRDVEIRSPIKEHYLKFSRDEFSVVEEHLINLQKNIKI